MEFSDQSRFVQLKGKTLHSQILNLMKDADWGASTNLESAFDKILDVAVRNKVPSDQMPKALIVISDMEINRGMGWGYNGTWSFHDGMEKKFAEYGYKLPTVIYWNVNSRNDVYHVDADKPGSILISGHSAGSFKQVLKRVNMTPVEAMEEVIGNERYDPIMIDNA